MVGSWGLEAVARPHHLRFGAIRAEAVRGVERQPTNPITLSLAGGAVELGRGGQFEGDEVEGMAKAAVARHVPATAEALEAVAQAVEELRVGLGQFLLVEEAG